MPSPSPCSWAPFCHSLNPGRQRRLFTPHPTALPAPKKQESELQLNQKEPPQQQPESLSKHRGSRLGSEKERGRGKGQNCWTGGH